MTQSPLPSIIRFGFSLMNARLFSLLALLFLLVQFADVVTAQTTSFSFTATSSQAFKATITPTVVLGGKTLSSIGWYFLPEQETPTVFNNANAFTHTYSGRCGYKTIRATATFTDFTVVEATVVTLTVACPGGATYSFTASSTAVNSVTVDPAFSVGTSGKEKWSIYYDWGDATQATFDGSDTNRTKVYDGCGSRTIESSATLSDSLTTLDKPVAISATPVTITPTCRLIIRYANNSPQVSFFSNRWWVWFYVTSNKSNTSAICHLLKPKHSTDSKNRGDCVPGTVVSMELPSSYTCGRVDVKTVGTKGSETDTIFGSASNNLCSNDATATEHANETATQHANATEHANETATATNRPSFSVGLTGVSYNPESNRV
ncbi:MAG: hypothetical protein OXG53_16490, partial [Chloroflexi bacterium]|nr:hypothetical protein [Chloroflexota bacterium]